MELMVAVAIMALMVVPVTISWRSFSNTVAVRNAPGHISGILHELSTEAILRKNKSISVFFEDAYLLADSRSTEARLLLNWENVKEEAGNCGAGSVRIISADEGSLFTTEPSGASLSEPVQMSAGSERCFNPLEHRVREVVYQLRANGDSSNKIRIFSLNLSANNSNEIFLEQNDYRLEISQPYGQKKRFDGENMMDDNAEVVITVKSKEGDESAPFTLPRK